MFVLYTQCSLTELILVHKQTSQTPYTAEIVDLIGPCFDMVSRMAMDPLKLFLHPTQPIATCPWLLHVTQNSRTSGMNYFIHYIVVASFFFLWRLAYVVVSKNDMRRKFYICMCDYMLADSAVVVVVFVFSLMDVFLCS